MSPVQTLDRSPGQLRSADELQPLHLALLREWNDLDDAIKRKRAKEFRQRAAETGRWIKSLEERDSVQTMIDYWSATMSAISGEGFPDPVTLAEFSEETVNKTAGKCPFVGLNPFQLRDSKYYFGRETDIEAVLAVFEKNAAAIILGASGMGKTSLAQAGVAGRLAAKGSEWLLVGSLVPGRDPVGALLRAIQPSPDNSKVEEQRAVLAGAPEKFRELAEARLSNPQQRLLVIVDRAEELFASDVVSSEIAVAVAAILALVAGPELGRHRVLFTIREDFADQLKNLITSTGNRLDDAAYHKLAPPDYGSVCDAIVKPAEVEGFRFDEQVVGDLATETANHPDAFPLLEFTLTLLWKRAEVDRVSWADYQQLPKPSQLLSDIAERTYDDLPSAEARAVAKAAFTGMIRLGQDVTVRRMRRADLASCVDDDSLDPRYLDLVLDRFVAADLLRKVPGEDRFDDRFELSHSAVIRHWPRLLIWIQEKRRREAGRERYTAALERWRAHDRRNSHLLPLMWLLKANKYSHLNRALDEYIIVSRRWWGWLFLLILSLILLFFLERGQLLQSKDAEIAKIEIAATTRQRAEGVTSLDLGRQAMVSDQALLRAIDQGLLPANQVPDSFLQRRDKTPSKLPPSMKPYDPQFLGQEAKARVALPIVEGNGVRLIHYPHTTIIYDALRKIPLVVASNIDLDGTSLTPFEGIGFFPDPRFPRSAQTTERVSSNPQYGRVPLVDWNLVSWVPAGSNARDASFLNFAPFSVLQPWGFYTGAWTMIDRRLFTGKARRLTILTGPILKADEAPVRGTIIPKAYWKAVIYWDEAKGSLQVEAYSLRTDAKATDRAAQDATTSLAAIAKQANVNFGRLPTNLAAPEAAAVESPTVYLQFAIMSRSSAVEISRKLVELNYKLPPEEAVESAKGLAEVRYVRADDAVRAVELARQTETLLSELGFGEVKVAVKPLTWVKKQPPAGTLELWLGVAPLTRTPTTSTYTVYGADDGFLVLRVQPTVESEELVRMRVGDRVECGEFVSSGSRWRPCSYRGLNGFASNTFLKPQK